MRMELAQSQTIRAQVSHIMIILSHTSVMHCYFNITMQAQSQSIWGSAIAHDTVKHSIVTNCYRNITVQELAVSKQRMPLRLHRAAFCWLNSAPLKGSPDGECALVLHPCLAKHMRKSCLL